MKVVWKVEGRWRSSSQ